MWFLAVSLWMLMGSALSFRLQLTRETQEGSAIVFPGANQPSKCDDPKWLEPLMDRNNMCSLSNGQIIFGGECVDILSQGPCPDGYWVVLNDNCDPQCRAKRCPGSLIPYANDCVNASSNSVCNTNEILYLEFTGEAYCDCEPLSTYEPTYQQCVYEHSQAWCPYGQYIEKDESQSFVCKANPCKDDSLIMNPHNGSCYQKEWAGKCTNEVRFRPDGTAYCSVVDNRNIFEVPALNSCPAGSKRDHLNNCRKVFRLTKKSFGLRIPSQHVNTYNFCPEGYVRYPNNTCKKPNSLFG